MSRGEVRGSQKVLLSQGRKRFGELTEETMAKLKSITDLSRLERMAERILDATGWEVLLATE